MRNPRHIFNYDKLTINQIENLEELYNNYLNEKIWNCWECETENTHNIDDFGFCKECLQSQ